MSNFIAAGCVVEELELRTGSGVITAFGARVVRIWEVVDGENEDSGWVVGGRPDIYAMGDEWAIEVGKCKSFGGESLMDVSAKLHVDRICVEGAWHLDGPLGLRQQLSLCRGPLGW